MKNLWFSNWKNEFNNNRKLIILSVLMLIATEAMQLIASAYVDKVASNPVTDIVLDNLPVVDLSGIFVYGWIVVTVVFLFYPFLYKIGQFHIYFSQFSFLLLVRSFFLTLTHLRVHPDVIFPVVNRFYDTLLFENDLFFSGHVAMPFLGYLLYRNTDKKIAMFFLISSIIMSITVLLMHIHYSIDVFSAFFITYGSYRLGKIIQEYAKNRQKN